MSRPDALLGPFDPLRALRVLLDHGVRFVLIGGLAGRVLGSPSVTNDLDICYARDRPNLGSLAEALVELGARLRGSPVDVPFLLDAQSLANGMNFSFATDAGALDCLGLPAGVAGYDELARGAEALDLDGTAVLVCSLDDLIRMKLAAARRKDLIEAEVLGALREERNHRPRR